MEPTQQKSNGALVGSIIIIIILILGGIYFLKSGIKNAPAPTDNLSSEEESTETSGNLAEIEAEAESMDLESLDSDI